MSGEPVSLLADELIIERLKPQVCKNYVSNMCLNCKAQKPVREQNLIA
jgi:hypothetical protein